HRRRSLEGSLPHRGCAGGPVRRHRRGEGQAQGRRQGHLRPNREEGARPRGLSPGAVVFRVPNMKNRPVQSLLFTLVTLLPLSASAANDGDHHVPHVENWWGALSETNAEAP